MQRRISGPSSFWSACDLSCTHTTGAASAVPLAFMPFDMLQTTCILTTCGCSGMLAMYRRRDDQRESLDWQSRGQAFGARALNPIECGPLPANVSFLSVLDDKTSQMLFVLWRQVALVKGHFFERTASCEGAYELTPVEMYFRIRLWVRSRTFCYVYSIDSDWIGISYVPRGHPRSPTTSIWGASPR